MGIAGKYSLRFVEYDDAKLNLRSLNVILTYSCFYGGFWQYGIIWILNLDIEYESSALNSRSFNVIVTFL